jgi:hypothetical protein
MSRSDADGVALMIVAFAVSAAVIAILFGIVHVAEAAGIGQRVWWTATFVGSALMLGWAIRRVAAIAGDA